jgi:tetratricopeptide (TPR) repeat protein
LEARDNLNKGVAAYSNSNYAGAAEYFQTALELDPEVPNAELYLAMSYAQQYIPNFATPENELFAEQAVATYESVLEDNPTDATAIAGLASIYQHQDKLDEAHQWYLRQVEVSPGEAVSHYSAGSITWHIIGNIAPELALSDPAAALPLTPAEEDMSEEELAAHRAERNAEVMALVEEGQAHLDRALEIDPDYELAMVFKNLLYRVPANMIPEDTEDEQMLARREELMALAEEWVIEADEARIRNQEEAAAQF